MSSSEKLSTKSPEQEHRKHELEKAGAELRELLQQRHEKAGEHSHENLDDAREQALEKAQSIEKQEQAPKQERQPSAAERRGGQPIRKAEREASFNATMQEVRSHIQQGNP
jgi:vacuolar-type H+-ATPase subunit H